jgi:hypothetical protein
MFCFFDYWFGIPPTKHYNKIKSRKGTKVAIIAAARKMMRMIYVMLKEDRSFRPDG